MATTAQQLALLRKVVAAKMAYWDALSDLEIAVARSPGDEIEADDEIASLAAGLSTPKDVHMITEASLKLFLRKVVPTPASIPPVV